MRKTYRTLFVFIVLLALAGGSAAVYAQSNAFDLSWKVIAGGGTAQLQSGLYSLNGSIGQAAAGPLTASPFDLYAGFWGKPAGAPTAVSVSQFLANGCPGAIQLTWLAYPSADTIGFNLYRREAGLGEYVLMNDEIVQAGAFEPVETQLTWLDKTAQTGQMYEYRLEEVTMSHERKWYGPVQAQMGQAFHVWMPALTR
jgi:hypothetical protein